MTGTPSRRLCLYVLVLDNLGNTQNTFRQKNVLHIQTILFMSKLTANTTFPYTWWTFTVYVHTRAVEPQSTSIAGVQAGVILCWQPAIAVHFKLTQHASRSGQTITVTPISFWEWLHNSIRGTVEDASSSLGDRSELILHSFRCINQWGCDRKIETMLKLGL